LASRAAPRSVSLDSSTESTTPSGRITRTVGVEITWNVAPICMRLGITSHGLAMYLLEGADDATGVGCLGGECFGEAGRGFLRFSCAERSEGTAA